MIKYYFARNNNIIKPWDPRKAILEAQSTLETKDKIANLLSQLTENFPRFQSLINEML